MADLVDVVLDRLSKQDCVDSLKLSEETGIDHQKIVGAIKSLQSLGDVIECEQTSSMRWQLTPEGEEIAKTGSHEAIVFYNVPSDGIKQEELFEKVGSANGNVGFRKAMSLNWISIDKKAEGGPRIFRKVEEIVDEVREICRKLADQDLSGLTDQQKSDCKKRKLVTESKIVSYVVRRGAQFTTTLEKQETELTQEMLASGSWKTKKFKEYNFNAKGLEVERGHLHPLLKVRTEFRQIFLEMGFSEMPTNNFVESSFWNFDALFQPQQHPARDAHDTFFLSDPVEAKSFPMDYLEKVKAVHSSGGYGSLGHKSDWKLKEAAKNIMRTHTTGVSARMLHMLACQPTFVPSKFFSIDRVFRNETLDATHLAEFHQIEGLVADYGLSLGDLMGYIQEFFKKYGIKNLKFKPAYNPYTEPSMEIFSYHEGLKKWVEIGNSGMFRPEMLLPMGLPKDVSVIAWGLSLERPTMIKYGISNIRDLFGPRVDLQKVYDNPLCRLGAEDDQNEAETSISSSKRPSIDLLLLEKRLDRLIVRLSIAKSRLEGCEDKFCEQLREKNREKVEVMEVQQLQSCQKSVLSRAPVSKTSFVEKNDCVDDQASSAPAKMKLDLTNSLGLSLTVPSDCCGDDLVLWCDPRSPPLGVVVLLAILDSAGSIGIASLVHSSLGCIADEERANLKALFCSKSQHNNTTLGTREKRCRRVTVVWKDLDGRTDCLMPVGQRACILGEGSVARFISDAIESEPKNSIGFRNPSDASSMAMADNLVECCRRGSSTKEIIGCVSSLLKSSAGPMLFGSQLSLADVMAWSTLTKIKSCRELPPVVQTWYKHCTQLPEFSNALVLLTNN